MTSPQDNGIVFGVESAFGTIPTLNRWVEPLGDAQFSLNKSIRQGAGLRVGSRVSRSGRRVITRYDPTASFSVEAQSKGQGLLWQALLGSSSSSLVSGSTYQQNHTIGDTPTSLSIQESLYNASTAVMDPYTFAGMMCDGFDIDFSNADLLRIKTNWKGKSALPATATAVPAFTAPAQSTLFAFQGASITTGTLTGPTATTTASAATTLADVRGGTISVARNLKVRPNIGGDAKPVPGITAITGKLDVEYDSNTFVNAVLNDTPMALVLTWTGGTLGVGLETLQIVLPAVLFDSDLPQFNGDDVVMVPASFQVLDNSTAAPITVVCRTADIAL